MKETIRTVLKPLYYALRHVFSYLWLMAATIPAHISKRPVVFIIGAPTHRNLGDQAILLAEIEYLKRVLPRVKVINISCRVMLQNAGELRKAVRRQDLIVGHGGGNMGDVYMVEEACRRSFVQTFPDNKIIIFPQTIHFSDSETGRAELEKTQAIYANHANLTLIAREQISFKRMREAFRQNNVILTPDIVLSLSMSAPSEVRNGLLLCLRDDVEATLTDKDKEILTDFAKRHFETVRHTDTVAKEKHYDSLPKARFVHAKLDEFKGAQLVVTDRLHGMVFAAITGTPCIAMANFNHKVSQTYEWIKHLPYIKFCNATTELEALLKELDITQTYTYEPAHFDQYWLKIQDILASPPQVTRGSK